MATEVRPKDYPKLKNYQPSRFMLPISHYDKKNDDVADKAYHRVAGQAEFDAF